jgi:hypothetical protein
MFLINILFSRLAITLCFEQKAVVKQEVLSEVLSSLIEMDPIPQLTLYTVISTVSTLKQMMVRRK